jgi:iron(III) transport system ATP-binding protein
VSTLQITDLVKTYDGVTEPAVKGVSISLRSGEVLSLLGPSGCGKSTILKCVAGLEEPTSGRIQVGDVTVADARTSVPIEKRDIGMVFQSYALWPHKTVFENVALGLRLRKMSRQDVHDKVMESLTKLEVAELRDRFPGQISGGQQQRVALSRSLVLAPKVLLFDEPLSNLDAKIRERVRDDLYEILQRVRITTLYVTHDRSEAMCMSDDIAVMRDGVIEQLGSAQDLYLRPRSAFVAGFIGTCNQLPVVPLRDPANHPGQVLQVGDDVAAYRIAHEDETLAGVVGFRPHDVSVVDREGPNTLCGKVVRQIFYGAETELTVVIGDRTVRVSVPQEVLRDEVILRIPRDKAMFFAE